MRRWRLLLLGAAFVGGCEADGLPGPFDMAAGPVDMFRSGPPPTVITHGDWFSFCQAFTACGLYPGTSLSVCLSDSPSPGKLSFAPPSVLACLKSAGADCVKVHTCLNDGNADYACDVDAGLQPVCNDDRYTLCYDPNGFKFTVDCGELGLACVGVPPGNLDPGYSGCGFGTCATDGGAAGQNLCMSGLATACNGGGRLQPKEDCRVYDQEACAVSDGGTAACVGTGAACTKDRCEGSELFSCKGGHEASFDCAKQGLTCVAEGDGTARCALGTQCDPLAYTETCSGNVLKYCDLGLEKTVDCVAAGWKKCVPLTVDAQGIPSGGNCSQ